MVNIRIYYCGEKSWPGSAQQIWSKRKSTQQCITEIRIGQLVGGKRINAMTPMIGGSHNTWAPHIYLYFFYFLY